MSMIVVVDKMRWRRRYRAYGTAYTWRNHNDMEESNRDHYGDDVYIVTSLTTVLTTA